MPPRPLDSDAVEAVLSRLRWITNALIALTLLFCFAPVAGYTVGYQLTVKSLLFVAAALFILVCTALLFSRITRSRVMKYIHQHNALVCPFDFYPMRHEDTCTNCRCTECGLHTNSEAVVDFWNEARHDRTKWSKWIVNRSMPLHEFPFDLSYDSKNTRHPNPEQVVSRIASARLLYRLSCIVDPVGFALIFIVAFKMSSSFDITFLVLLVLFITFSWWSSRVESKAKNALRNHIRANRSLVCPKDFYPLVETDPEHQSFLCPECGLESSRPILRSFWANTIGSSFRWWTWIVFNRPRINTFPLPDPPG